MSDRYDVIVVGSGPAGIFSVLELVKNNSNLKILMLEKGQDINKRACPVQGSSEGCKRCNPCSVVCGWGGAGAFSDGKLTLSTEIGGSLEEYIGENKLKEMIEYIDKVYLDFGAPQELHGLGNEEEVKDFQERAVKSELKLIPVAIRHLGTGRCKEILENMYKYLISRGVEVRTKVAVDSLIVEDEEVKGIKTNNNEIIYGKNVIIAPGREGAQWLARQIQTLNLNTVINPVDIGVRVELPAKVMEKLTQVFYEAKLIYYSKAFDDRVRTFCMNPYGEVVMENNDGLVTVNGHSHAYKKTENTNFAVLVSKTFTEPFKEPIAYGKYIASLANLLGDGVIVQRLGDLITGQRTTKARMSKCLVRPTLTKATPGDLSLVFPYRHLVAVVEMLKALDEVAPGVYSRYTLLYGVEVKFYSSRLSLSNSLETEIKNLYAVGDGAGVTRGLAQASSAGVIAAREILNRL
ncbi:MAG: FAD-binding protein [Clostridiales bacterium]|nr:FAD-binding protein [Clostridiales bacterium]MCF8022497.1 FAD-binding protein [Clostridiales bacterium]